MEAGGGAGAEVGLPFQRARGVCVLPLLIPVSRETGARQTRGSERGERESHELLSGPGSLTVATRADPQVRKFLHLHGLLEGELGDCGCTCRFCHMYFPGVYMVSSRKY